MLRTLHINNIALIDELELELREGFNVLSGETGAGKSIIIDSVNFVLGERANRELIKTGTQKARTEALFDISRSTELKTLLDAQGIDRADDELVLSRELTAAGKNMCRVNGMLVPVSILKQISDLLVDIHGQHEHQSLLSPENHTGFLDRFAHAQTEPLLQKLAEICEEYNTTKHEKHAGFGSEAERRREADMLSFQIDEIDSAAIELGEDERLSAERLILQNAERIKSSLSIAHTALSEAEEGESTLSSLDAARRSIREISALSKEYEALFTRLEEAYYSIEDIAYSVRDAGDALEFDAQRLDEIEDRMQMITTLKRKYGNSIEEILDFSEKAKTRLDNLTRADEYIAELDAKLDALAGQYREADKALCNIRREAAAELRTRVLENLADLGLGKADFSAAFTNDDAIKPEGTLKAEFLLSANPGEPLKPLAKVASGGELSRIMLCFKAIFADNDSIGTLIFDEIDTGISGRVAAMVGEKMLGIARNHQVICVTHLPQIAALADRHFVVEKHTDGMTTSVDVRELDEEGKYRRIAQMMDGEADSTYGYEHARMLIERAAKLKSKN